MNQFITGMIIAIVLCTLWVATEPTPEPCSCSKAEWKTINRVMDYNNQQLEICDKRYAKENAWHDRKDSIIREHWNRNN